jgi:hypothetical protein
LRKERNLLRDELAANVAAKVEHKGQQREAARVNKLEALLMDTARRVAQLQGQASALRKSAHAGLSAGDAEPFEVDVEADARKRQTEHSAHRAVCVRSVVKRIREALNKHPRPRRKRHCKHESANRIDRCVWQCSLTQRNRAKGYPGEGPDCTDFQITTVHVMGAGSLWPLFEQGSPRHRFGARAPRCGTEDSAGIQSPAASEAWV